MQPYKVCPNCQQPSVLDSGVCTRCGHLFSTQFTPPANRTQAFYSPVPIVQTTPAPPNTAIIFLMWIITVVNIVAVLTGTWPMGIAFCVDLFPFVFAIFLACSKNRTDKVNGWVKLSFEILAALGGFLSGFMEAAMRR